MIINSRGKIVKTYSLDKLIREATLKHLEQAYKEFEKFQLNTATGEFLDRFAELYGWTRQDSLLVPIREEVVRTKAHERFRITSSGKTNIQGRIGFTVSEKIGVGIINPRGIARGKKSVVVGE